MLYCTIDTPFLRSEMRKRKGLLYFASINATKHFAPINNNP